MKNKGFTIIELMVVIAISAILLAIALPAFQSMEHMEQETQASEQFTTGDCVFHRLDKSGDTEGVVLKTQHGTVSVRFGMTENSKSYDPIELRHCSGQGTIRVN